MRDDSGAYAFARPANLAARHATHLPTPIVKITPPSLDKLLLWLTEAATVFLNGCLAGIGGGTAAGAGTGAVAATASGTITPGSISAALLAAAFSAGGNGIKRLIVWHDTNPIPNPFVAEQKSSAP